MDQALYDTTKQVVEIAVIGTDDTTTLKQARSVAHEATMEVFRLACQRLRKQPDLNLEKALFLFGERLTTVTEETPDPVREALHRLAKRGGVTFRVGPEWHEVRLHVTDLGPLSPDTPVLKTTELALLAQAEEIR